MPSYMDGSALVRGSFSVDDSGEWPGWYHPGVRWNGWLVPYFEADTLDDMAITFTHEDDSENAYIERRFTDGGRDSTWFLVTPAYADEEEEITGTLASTREGLKVLYCVGGFSWCWTKAGE